MFLFLWKIPSTRLSWKPSREVKANPVIGWGWRAGNGADPEHTPCPTASPWLSLLQQLGACVPSLSFPFPAHCFLTSCRNPNPNYGYPSLNQHKCSTKHPGSGIPCPTWILILHGSPALHIYLHPTWIPILHGSPVLHSSPSFMHPYGSMGWQSDEMILAVFPNLNDSILHGSPILQESLAGAGIGSQQPVLEEQWVRISAPWGHIPHLLTAPVLQLQQRRAQELLPAPTR